MNKKEIAKELKDIQKEEIVEEYKKLREIGETQKKILISNSPLGNTIVDFFTFQERLHTAGTHDMNFYQFLDQLPELKDKPYVKNMVAYYRREQPTVSPMKVWYRIFSLYFGSINTFKPLVAMSIYKTFAFTGTGGTRILDPTAGWGSRLIGASCCPNVESYIGIELNQHLKTPYQKMEKFIQDQGDKQSGKLRIRMIFKSALTVDYSKLSYNLCFTSPPYYNIETYHGVPIYKTKDEWDSEFYFPLFEKTHRHLEKGGWWCINIPIEIYERVCIPLLGKAEKQIPLAISSRNTGKNSGEINYKEFIYCWKK